MPMNFSEPNVQQTLLVSDIFENLTVSPENKEWLYSLLLYESTIPVETQSDFKNSFEELVKKSDETGSNSFKVLFLFDYNDIQTMFPDCFDQNKLSRERINILPELFTEKQGDKPAVFKEYAAYILDNIQNCAKKDKNFSEAYQEYLQEIRSSSSFEERALYYIKLIFQNLPGRTYEENEKPPAPEKIYSFLDFGEEDFYKSPLNSLKMIGELEEIPVYINYLFQGNPILEYSILAFPFIICGKELYSCIYKTVNLLLLTTSGQKLTIDDIAQIEIPRWNNNNYIHEFFFILAQILNDKDISKFILDKVFEEINAVDIPYIFFKYIGDNACSIYGTILKGGYSEIVEPVRAELEYLDWALITDTSDPHKIYFDKSRLFLDYLDKLSGSTPKDKLELFQELFFSGARKSHTYQIDKFWDLTDKTIKDILDSFAHERKYGEWTFPARIEEVNALYEEFVDVIAKGAAKYPVESFLPEELQNLSTQELNDYEFTVFKRYCEKLELKNSEDAFVLSKFWFERFHFEQKFARPLHLSSEYLNRLIEKEAFFYKKVFLKFIDDEDFIFSFLSIPENYYGGYFLVAYYIACWVLYKNQDKNLSDVFIEASKKLLHGKKIIFPEKIVEFIKSYKISDEFLNYRNVNVAVQFLINLSAAVDSEQYNNILKNINKVEECFSLCLIWYKYSHEKFIQEEFTDFLLGLKSPGWIENGTYNLEIIQEACEKKELEKQIVLEKVSDYFDKNRKELLKLSNIRGIVLYFFTEPEENKTLDSQTAFFIRFCERAVQENEDSCTELYMFLKLRSLFRKKIDTILEKNTETNNILITRCCKMLNNFKRNIEQKKFPEDEHTFLDGYILPASDFVWEKTENIWKALKPLILAFRASKDILLNESLNTANNTLSYLLLNMITSFFMIEDQEKLKDLRYNMANDFAEYLKPAKNERQTEKYTQTERETEGFDLSYTEPSSYWRYAYVRALGDLAVKTDKRGHYFHKILENVSEEDPSEDVKSAATKVMKELDLIRKGYSGANHKKCLFEAFWWLKQAHVLSLGGEVDSKKALELRIKEWR